MCGIVAYIGKQAATEVLLQGLSSLEYRGYDSAGIALVAGNDLSIIKSSGKVANLRTSISSQENQPTASVATLVKQASCGIGHTRWATHGAANDINAHPHPSADKSIALVHNGIIKNHYQIKEQLMREGVEFISDTDTEVIVQLFSKYRKQGNDDLIALNKTIKDLDGSYAIAIVSKNSQEILLAKNQSPLVIGLGDGENFVASDSSTVLQFTNKIVKLKDKQCACIQANTFTVYDYDCKPVTVEPQTLTRSISIFDKGPYKHFLLKEIYEQTSVIATMLGQSLSNPTAPIQGFEQLNINFKDIKRIVFVACGSAYHAALLGKYLIETWGRIKTEVIVASEFNSIPPLLDSSDLVIGVSQSGETADTLSAINHAQEAGAKVMAITNKIDSALYDLCLPNTYVTPAGMEVSVASTKAFTSQVMALYLLAIKIAESKQLFDLQEIKKELHTLPLIIDQTLERADEYKEQLLKYSAYRDFIFLSRGVNYPIALEGALKLKELSYIHATGYPSGEMKHGPIAILDQNVPVLSIAINGPSELEQTIYKKTLSNAQEAKARKSPALVVACDGNTDVENIFDEIIRIPNISQIFSPIIAVLPLQFLAYYIAEDLGKDVDQPRNLAKSVTVE